MTAQVLPFPNRLPQRQVTPAELLGLAVGLQIGAIVAFSMAGRSLLKSALVRAGQDGVLDRWTVTAAINALGLREA